MFQIDKRCWGN